MPIVLIDAPSNLGLRRPQADREPGVRFAPWQLRELGLLQQLSAIDGGVIEPPAYDGTRDVATGILHGAVLPGYALKIADALGPILDRGDFPLLLGGDCSIALGSALALRRRGRCGLVFVDGHRDLRLPQQSTHGACAGMDLALITGHGPEPLCSIEGYRPLLQADDVLLFGYRDADHWYQPELLALAAGPMRAVSLEQARMQDIDRVFARGLERLLATPPSPADAAVDTASSAANGLAGFWIHLDVDVLDDAAMSAVDAREPDGLTVEELTRLLRHARASGQCLGMHLSNYDPERDPGLACGRTLVALLAAALVDPEVAADDSRSAQAPL